MPFAVDAVLVSVGQALDWGRVRCYALDPYTDRSLLNIVNTTWRTMTCRCGQGWGVGTGKKGSRGTEKSNKKFYQRQWTRSKWSEWASGALKRHPAPKVTTFYFNFSPLTFLNAQIARIPYLNPKKPSLPSSSGCSLRQAEMDPDIRSHPICFFELTFQLSTPAGE